MGQWDISNASDKDGVVEYTTYSYAIHSIYLSCYMYVSVQAFNFLIYILSR